MYGHACLYFEFCFICFSHTFIRTVIIKTVSFFSAYSSLSSSSSMFCVYCSVVFWGLPWTLSIGHWSSQEFLLNYWSHSTAAPTHWSFHLIQMHMFASKSTVCPRFHLHWTIAVRIHSLKLVTLPDYRRQWWVQTGFKFGFFHGQNTWFINHYNILWGPALHWDISSSFCLQVGASSYAGLF